MNMRPVFFFLLFLSADPQFAPLLLSPLLLTQPSCQAQKVINDCVLRSFFLWSPKNIRSAGSEHAEKSWTRNLRAGCEMIKVLEG